MKKSSLAGIDMRDITRLADNTNFSLEDEIVATIRNLTSRRSNKWVNIFDVAEEVAENTDISINSVYDSFNTVYQDKRITVDKNGFVKLIESGKLRNRALKTATRNSKLKNITDRFSVPVWVKDNKIWKESMLQNDPEDTCFWGNVVMSYKRNGGRSEKILEKTSDFKPWPFDTHPPIWKVTNDNFLSKDMQTIQNMLSEGVEPEDLVNDMVSVGADKVVAYRLVQAAINSDILI